jgi:hypothetical protein
VEAEVSYSPKYPVEGLYEDEMRRPIPYVVPFGSAKTAGL